jgi:hypothetical protein
MMLAFLTHSPRAALLMSCRPRRRAASAAAVALLAVAVASLLAGSCCVAATKRRTTMAAPPPQMSNVPDTEALTRAAQAARDAKIVPDIVDDISPKCAPLTTFVACMQNTLAGLVAHNCSRA